MKHQIIILFVIALIFACAVLGVLVYVPDYQLRKYFNDLVYVFATTVKTVTVIAGLGIVLAVLIALLWLIAVTYASGVVWRSMARSRRAEALKLEREATLIVTIAPPGSQVYASEISGKLHIEHKPLYLAPGIVSGSGAEPTWDEVKRWSFFQLTQNISKRPDVVTEDVPQLQQPLPEYVDLSQHVTVPSLRNIFLGVGRLPNGLIQPINAPLSRLVHIAVAGSSGFGKSTLMQALGYQVINAREHPVTVMLDPQGVTFTSFEGSRNLRYPLASEEQDIGAILQDLLVEMEQRKELFSHWRGIDDLGKYNQVVDASGRLPVIPIFFDEFGLVADSKVIAKSVKKLAQAGRKFGMYLIAGSQTWYSDEISSSLKANLSTSIQFYAKSKSQSRVLLGAGEASQITRPGQAFCRLPGQPGLIELQAPDASSVLDVAPSLAMTEMASKPLMPQSSPDDLEQAILDLYDEQIKTGEINRAAISLSVFGSKGGNQYRKIDEVLAKFGRV
ncbi:MAG: hypothetical protein FOGNACKC_02865 [Anaerolineae bacterium]|nr:hypothetical protein [Anaerolineae bacterium]